jgi:hypothetical protein
MAGGVTMAGTGRLVVWRPAGLKGFEVVAVSNLENIPPNATTSFPVNIPVQPGDIISNAMTTGGDVPTETGTGQAADVYGRVTNGMAQPAVGQTAGYTTTFSTYGFNFFQAFKALNISAVISGEPPATPAGNPPTAAPPVTTPKKCKKGRKLRRGKCVRKKKKK